MGPHTGILRRGVWCASRRPPLGVRLFLSLFAVSRRFSLQPSCHLAVVPLSSFFPLSLLLLSRRSPLPRSATPPPPAVPLFSLLLAPFGAAPPSSLHILAPRVYRALLEQGRVASDAHCYQLPPSHVIAQVHSLFEHLCLH